MMLKMNELNWTISPGDSGDPGPQMAECCEAFAVPGGTCMGTMHRSGGRAVVDPPKRCPNKYLMSSNVLDRI